MSMTAFARDVGSRLHHRGQFIENGYDVSADLREIAAVVPADMKAAFAAQQIEMLSGYGFQPAEQHKPFAYADGVAIIPIHGLLLNRMSWSCSYATGYNFIRSQMQAAIADDDVKLIVYDVNSSGGLASGCKELADEMYEGRGEKPTLAVVDARCYSAAYFLASACDRVVVTPSGGVGSIGCVAMHVDFSGMLKADGIKVTYIFEGDEKVDGNPTEPLSKRALNSIQRDVSYHASLFVEAVARHRGMSEDEVRATEARCYLPPEALELGLIDAVQTPTEAVAEFFNEIASDAETEGDDIMDKVQNNANPAPAPAATIPAAPSMTQADVTKMVAEGVAQALAAEKTRSAGIRTCEEAEGRETLAAHLVENTSMSVDEAKAILAASPKAVEEKGRQAPSGFAAAMDRTPNPDVGADPDPETGAAGGEPTPQATASRLLTNFVGMTGRKVIGISDRSAA